MTATTTCSSPITAITGSPCLKAVPDGLVLTSSESLAQSVHPTDLVFTGAIRASFISTSAPRGRDQVIPVTLLRWACGPLGPAAGPGNPSTQAASPGRGVQRLLALGGRPLLLRRTSRRARHARTSLRSGSHILRRPERCIGPGRDRHGHRRHDPRSDDQPLLGLASGRDQQPRAGGAGADLRPHAARSQRHGDSRRPAGRLKRIS